MPTPITFNVPSQQRAAGDYLVGPALIPAGYSWASLLCNIPTADYENAANGMDIVIEISNDGGATWQHKASIDNWVGGKFVAQNGTVDPPPGIWVGIKDIAGFWQARGRVSLKSSMQLGFTLQLT